MFNESLRLFCQHAHYEMIFMVFLMTSLCFDCKNQNKELKLTPSWINLIVSFIKMSLSLKIAWKVQYLWTSGQGFSVKMWLKWIMRIIILLCTFLCLHQCCCICCAFELCSDNWNFKYSFNCVNFLVSEDFIYLFLHIETYLCIVVLFLLFFIFCIKHIQSLPLVSC